MNDRPEIDGLRALTVIPVVLFHDGVAGFGGGLAGLDHTVRELLDAGVDVWLVRDVPRFEFDPPRRLFSAEKFGGSTDDIGQTYEEYVGYQAPVDEVFSELESLGARVVDLPALLCRDGYCPVVLDDIVLYRDSNHLTVEGSLFVSAAFSPMFQSLAQE